ncbi:hypothetical protein C7212DRAFT_340849 [Tuber magnatum]|uniref:Uncharacterized protein n=1 Tax=Tuber magnatum TaxID=42249 RepID=A0A317T1V8_9PEZI|nr:hypothetical protein C7212DRAFT_340849 [Tuber magnatum]
MSPRRNLSSRAEALERRIEEQRKTIAELRKTGEELRKSGEELRKTGGELRKPSEELKNSYQRVRSNLTEVISTAVVPIVAAVVLESFYKKCMQSVHTGDPLSEDGADIIRRHRNRFDDFGLADEQEMLEFAEAWPGVMSAGDTAAHGDEVVLALSYCQGNLHRVLQRAFTSLWGISPGDWHNATEA